MRRLGYYHNTQSQKGHLHIGQREVHEAGDGGGNRGGEQPIQHRGDGGSVRVGDRQLLAVDPYWISDGEPCR